MIFTYNGQTFALNENRPPIDAIELRFNRLASESYYGSERDVIYVAHGWLKAKTLVLGNHWMPMDFLELLNNVEYFKKPDKIKNRITEIKKYAESKCNFNIFKKCNMMVEYLNVCVQCDYLELRQWSLVWKYMTIELSCKSLSSL